MKITSPTAIKIIAMLGAWVIRGWIGTCRVKVVFADVDFKPVSNKKYLFGFWHENIIPVAYSHCCEHVATLVSRHRDGELITQVINRFGGKTFRGSTTRGGAAALRKMILDRHGVNIAITPDGPKGPRREVQKGAIYLAAKTQMPLIPIGYAASKYRRAGIWDKMLLPKTFSKIVGVFGKPMTFPEDIDRDQIEKYRLQFQQAMDDAQQQAEELSLSKEPLKESFRPKKFNKFWF